MNGFHCRAQTVEKFTGMRPRHTPGGNFNPPSQLSGSRKVGSASNLPEPVSRQKSIRSSWSGPAPTDGQRSGRR